MRIHKSNHTSCTNHFSPNLKSNNNFRQILNSEIQKGLFDENTWYGINFCEKHTENDKTQITPVSCEFSAYCFGLLIGTASSKGLRTPLCTLYSDQTVLLRLTICSNHKLNHVKLK